MIHSINSHYLLCHFYISLLFFIKIKMIMQFHKAPMHYVDGEAAYKSGEWAGLKSCKFGPTRRVIRAVSKESIFDSKYKSE